MQYHIFIYLFFFPYAIRFFILLSILANTNLYLVNLLAANLSSAFVFSFGVWTFCRCLFDEKPNEIWIEEERKIC